MPEPVCWVAVPGWDDEDYVRHLHRATPDTVDELRDLSTDDTDDFMLALLENDNITDHLPSLCTRGRDVHARDMVDGGTELVQLDDYLADHGLTTDRDGDAPDGLCSYCWNDVEADPSHTSEFDSTATADTVAATRYRWKLRGHARSVKCDLLVPDDAPMTDLQTAISVTLGLDDEFHAWMFCDHQRYEKATIEICPTEMFSHSGQLDEYDAAETTGGDVLDIFVLGEGDRFYYIYDFGTPVVTYGILKERVDDPATRLEETSPEATYGDVTVLKSKDKAPPRYE